MQVTIDLQGGRSVALPVSETTRGAGVLAYTAMLLGCTPGDGLRLWPSGGGGMLGETERVVPGTSFRAKLPVSDGPGRRGGCAGPGWSWVGDGSSRQPADGQPATPPALCDSAQCDADLSEDNDGQDYSGAPHPGQHD